MTTPATSISLLREVADAVERLGENQVRELLRSGSAPLPKKRKTTSGLSNSKRVINRKAPLLRLPIINESFQRLKVAQTREEALESIRNASLSRRELESLARTIDVPIRKDQNTADLEELIVNVTVGGRLNSLAIRQGS